MKLPRFVSGRQTQLINANSLAIAYTVLFIADLNVQMMNVVNGMLIFNNVIGNNFDLQDARLYLRKIVI